MADGTYPDDLLYHPEHDWARIDGETATFGITWYAQDALGEVVFFDPPEVGTSVSKDEAYAEVEGTVTARAVVEAAQTLPMIAPRRVVVVLQAERLFAGKKRRGAEADGDVGKIDERRRDGTRSVST